MKERVDLWINIWGSQSVSQEPKLGGGEEGRYGDPMLFLSVIVSFPGTLGPEAMMRPSSKSEANNNE